MARLARIEALASEAKDEAALARVQALRKREQARHDKKHAALLKRLPEAPPEALPEADDDQLGDEQEPGVDDEGEGEDNEDEEQGGAP
jgi:hypothetical protein